MVSQDYTHTLINFSMNESRFQPTFGRSNRVDPKSHHFDFDRDRLVSQSSHQERGVTGMHLAVPGQLDVGSAV